MADNGPWFAICFVHCDNQEQTHYAAHTYPQLVLADLNHKAQTNVWQMASKVGPFDVWSDCAAFVQHMSLKRDLFSTCVRTKRVSRWSARKVGLLKAGCIQPKKKYK